MAFEDLREDYQGTAFEEGDCAESPIGQFQRWFQAATEAEIPMANAMTLATVDERGRPHARIVLLKEFDERGFVFFTNYESRKGQQLAASSRAALVFWWHPLTRQIRIEGRVEKVSAAESDAYFETRPRGSNLAAMASAQSQPLASRAVLEDAMRSLERSSGEAPLERPAFWGGYRVEPECVEFWQGRPDRSHDRLEYTRNSSGKWQIARLYP